MRNKTASPDLSNLSTEELIGELARRRAAEVPADMTAMELEGERDALALKDATMAARLSHLSEEEDDRPKRCPRCGTRCRVKAKHRERKLRTLSGEHSYRRNYHYCEGCRSGWYPLDVELGIPESGEVTLELEKRILDFGVTEVFADAAERWSVHYEMRVSENLVRRVVERVGRQEAASSPTLLQKELRPQRAPSADNVLVVGVDGSMLPMRGAEPWREVKVGVVARREANRQLAGARYVAALGPPEALKPQLSAALDAEDAERSTAVWLGDGAPWVWKLAEALLPDAHQVLDWPHVAEHLVDCATALFDDAEPCFLLWLGRARELAWNGEIAALLNELQACLFLVQNEAQREAIRDLIRYCRTNQERMNYKVFREAGFPVGSGVVESAHKHVLQQRMKRAGQHWNPERANTMARLRAAYRTAGPANFHRAIGAAFHASRELAA